MRLTKIKRKDLKRGDMFCVQYKNFVSEIYMVTTDGDDVIDSISNMSVLRIDVPDYIHELTQFSWKLKQLDDRIKDRGDRVDGLEQKLCLHADSEKAMYAVLKSAFGDLNRRVDKVEHAPDQDDRIEKLASKLEWTERSRVRLASMINIRDYRIEGMVAQINKLLNAIYERDQRIEELLADVPDLEEDNRDLKTIAANSESYTHRMDELLGSCKSDVKQRDKYIEKLMVEVNGLESVCKARQNTINAQTSQIEHLKSANKALSIDIRSHEGVRTQNRELHSRVEELEAELNDMSREMSNRCVCSDPTGAQKLKLLHDILQIVNPIIKSGEYARPAQSGVVLAQRMWDLCHTVIDFRRKHNIVG